MICHVRDPLPPLSSPLRAAFGRPFWYEGRAGLELSQLARTTVPLGPGRDRRVVIVTGFLAGASTADPLSGWLRSAGYRVELAPTGRNLLGSGEMVDRVTQTLQSADGEPSILIGHSRGGQQSRVAAYRDPGLVSHLITLGAPVRAHLPRSAPLRVPVETIRLLDKMPFGPSEDGAASTRYEADLFASFDVDVPWTSIHSRVDGVIDWRETLDPNAESVRVRSSHTGLIASVPAFEAIAAVLDG